MTPGRSCPLNYRYAPAVFKRNADFETETLYNVGGLYGKRAALTTILELAAREVTLNRHVGRRTQSCLFEQGQGPRGLALLECGTPGEVERAGVVGGNGKHLLGTGSAKLTGSSHNIRAADVQP